ncbi:cytochrome d ubiquinol oxidase, subunit II [Alkalidesulfovibrio alkalitolerans DSM 16529]|jgi:cytochrome d ubiquinol oxidase subunit II|uniref:Cytochrome d ubiquinol oxidase, subunit II n=1 Tax=Alkalidesulfovibrio alkalitolerans DSM 16529 TaxID=1121439 RepID=S7TFL1_9BACT|nr:cytochrome d ubiquinol oxidase subunit II [Alkalidesulfovibrio alkalitolerans]EPR35370.1 cytochrome d ubiquinol oxidase, subunit II [Alkalidesulfovibrio alkalitolerans DSM 16529]
MLADIWFFLWGLLWAMYFVLDGFDLGAGTLMPFVAKSDDEKRTLLNAAGPFWDGNEVWLITAGGVTFAAFPQVYAAMFSGLYTALMLLLFALIVRAVSFEFRGKLDGPGWRKLWDGCQFVGSAAPAILLGVAFANIFAGLPVAEDGFIRAGILDLLNPYGLAGGVLFLTLFMVHGAIWLCIRSGGELHARARTAATVLWPVLVFVVLGFLVMTAVSTNLYANYLENPVLLLVPLVAVAGLVSMRVFIGARAWWKAFFASAATILGCTFFGIVGLFPALIPSSIDAAYSLTTRNASASELNMTIMLGVAAVFVPIVLIYQFWTYKTFATRLTQDDLDYDEAY